ncbi:hypothetical protein AB0G87_38630, partial [Streptomyces asoensis]
LRLARYGVPLAETAPAGLAAAGIEPPVLPAAQVTAAVPQQQLAAADPGLRAVEAAPAAQEQREFERAVSRPVPLRAAGSVVERLHASQVTAEESAERFAEAYQAFIAKWQVEPTPDQWALWLRDAYGIFTGSGSPLSEDQAQPLLQVLRARYALHSEHPAASGGADTGDQSWYDYFHSAWRTYAQERGTYPDAAALAAYVYERDSITGDSGRPITADDVAGFVTSFKESQFDSGAAAEGADADPVPQGRGESFAQGDPEAAPAAGAQAAKEKRSPRVDAAIDDLPQGREVTAGPHKALTTVDRYYLAWTEYQTEHGAEPTDEQLSAYLARKGLYGRGRKQVSPATLRRYFLPFRVHSVWAEHRMRTEMPEADAIAQECAARGITAQYNKPVTTGYINDNTDDFERRWQALARYRTDAQQ